jgi:hypothetical protein
MIVCPSVCRSLYVFLSYSFGHCIICPSVCRSLYVFLSYSFGHCIICPPVCRSLYVFLSYSFGHCIICPSILFTDSDYLYFIYWFWLPLFYLQILITSILFTDSEYLYGIFKLFLNMSWNSKIFKKKKKCYPLANKVVKGCSNATVRLSVTSLWTL